MIDFVSLDYETFRFQPGLMCPPIVCGVLCEVPGSPVAFPTSEVFERTRQLLLNRTIVGWTIDYDMMCAIVWYPELRPLIKKAYEENRVLCGWAFERIAEIQGKPRGDLSLDSVSQRYGFPKMDKDLMIRTTFDQYYNRPLSDYSEKHMAYLLGDGDQTLQTWNRQLQRNPNVHLEDVALLAREKLWLNNTRQYGMRTDPERVSQLEKSADEHLDFLTHEVQELGFVRTDGTRCMSAIKAAVSEAYRGHPPTTPTGEPKTDHVTLTESGDPILELFAEYGEWSKVKNADVKLLSAGTQYPIHTKYGTADTFRTTSSRPNLQNLRSKEGIRECIRARDGYALVPCDHACLELCTWSQVCVTNLGIRDLADKLNKKFDCHCEIAAEILHCSYEDAVKMKDDGSKGYKARQCGKVANFGLPGRMGAERLVFAAKTQYRTIIGIDESKDLKNIWLRTRKEAWPYFNWIEQHPTDQNGLFYVQIPGTTIVRSGATFCAAHNHPFQSFGAVVEAHVGWGVMWATYDPNSPLWGSHMVNFAHDDFMLEIPLDRLDEGARELQRIMCEVPKMDHLLPDVVMRAEYSAMTHWSKRCIHKTHADGRLAVCCPVCYGHGVVKSPDGGKTPCVRCKGNGIWDQN